MAALAVAPACADILGIDAPQKRAAAEVSGAGSPEGGDAGASGNSGSAGSAGFGTLEVVTPVGGGPGEAGSGGISGAGGRQNSPSFSCAQTTLACPGAEAIVNLTASDGVPPYRWELLESDPAFTLLGADTARATVTGAPARSGTYPLRIQVTDAMNKPFARRCDVSVIDVPVIDQASVPSVCPGEFYSVELAAHGGDASSYQWTIPDLPQSTGLAIADGRLSGKFLGAPHDADHLDFTLQLSDSGSSSAQCVTAPVKLTLNLETPSSLVCTSVGVDKQVVGKPPPGPCLGNPYNEKLVVRRGVGATTMAASVLPSGLSFDPATQSLSGFALADGPLSIVVIDSVTNRRIESTFDLKRRDACWLAYVSKETGNQRLRLFDALLGNRKTLPSSSSSLLSESEVVRDFKFSPDGKYLAFRLGPPNAPAGLVLEKVSTWQESRLGVTDVTQYEWSADSQTLAIAYNTAQGSSLTGLNVQAQLSSGPTNPQSPTPIVFPLLGTTPASVDSVLVWFDGPHLGFLKKYSDSSLYPSTTTLAAQGFAAVSTRMDSPSPPGTQLVPAVKGLFLIPPPEVELMLYYGSDGSLPVLHDGVVVAPSGHYTARAEDHSLSLFRAIDDSFSGDPYDQMAGCDTVLSWAPRAERIACTRQIANANDHLLIFDVSRTTDKLSVFADVPLSVPFPDSAHIERRRLFSPSGARFAFNTDDTLSVVSLTSAASQAEFDVQLSSVGLLPNDAHAELSFSPDGLMLLQHRGSRLSFFDLLNPGLGEVRLSDSLAASVACKEDFQDQKDGWCGIERPHAPFSWAPASDLAVFQDANGALQVYDLTWRQQGLYSLIAVHAQCTQDCLVDGQFAFQPSATANE